MLLVAVLLAVMLLFQFNVSAPKQMLDIVPEIEDDLLNLRIPSFASANSDAFDRKYGIVIDAGSSGSRVYIYSWKNPASEPKRQQSITIEKPGDLFELKQEPGSLQC